jgi:hypothetical protein
MLKTYCESVISTTIAAGWLIGGATIRTSGNLTGYVEVSVVPIMVGQFIQST